VIRTARRARVIRTVAVYSDADRGAARAHGRRGGAYRAEPARESYLVGDKIIEAAKDAGAEAIHPGYGFLSRECGLRAGGDRRGLVWVGPKPDSIRAMGLKDAAKTIMIEAGVPVTPGYLGEDQDPKRLKKEADASAIRC
jgi:3-methylcrotonyl-CoA carboxylase alpha subunit